MKYAIIGLFGLLAVENINCQSYTNYRPPLCKNRPPVDDQNNQCPA